MDSTIEMYYQLRDEVDRKAAELGRIHTDWIACKKGCSGCCMNLSVWPVEFYAILEEIQAAGWPRPQLDHHGECVYLDTGSACQIYPFRPLICRTHGLPLVYWHEDTSPPGYGVMFCEKNFKNAEIDFGPHNSLNMEEANEQLARLNLAFIEENPDLGLEPATRIELHNLLNYL